MAWESSVSAQDEDDPFTPGMVATFRDAAGHQAIRIDPFLAYHAAAGIAPDSRLVPGAFQATWQGFLRTGVKGEHRFYLFGTGEVELKVNGKVVVARSALKNEWRESAAVPLEPDYLPLELSLQGDAATGRVMVFWSGPRFGLEPVPPRVLFHTPEKSPGGAFERGRFLAQALRCGQCHTGEPTSRPAPALDHLSGQLASGWLEHWLTAEQPPAPAKANEEPAAPRRMPSFGLSPKQSQDIADWLLAARVGQPPVPPRAKLPEPSKPKGKAPPKPSAAAGEQLFVALGCLACHTWNDLGAGGWFGGGDLSRIADKRPPAFFAEWLADPSRLNRDHRMPTFTLNADERTSLALFLAGQKSANAKPNFAVPNKPEGRARGEKLVADLQCSACHQLPGPNAGKPAAEREAATLGAKSDWAHACSGAPDAPRHRPGYRLAEKDAQALKVYFTTRQAPTAAPAPKGGHFLLADSNCLACHARQGTREGTPLLPPALADKLTAVGKRYPNLAPQLAALMPPTLNSVGDKLTDAALAEAIARTGEPHRPYLQVRMPRFALTADEMNALVGHLIADDRVPPRERPPALDPAREARFKVAGGRLVSGDGFGCTSCHRVGEVQPPPGPASSRGPDLSMMSRRVRREWYDRWVRDPARIVPRMEMPAVQIAVAGVLDDKLDDQIAAVWHVLNLPGFEPPPPDPVRILRHHGHDPRAEALLVTDQVRVGKQTLLKPFLIGLANRHNVLLDLEAGGLAQWSTGDTARQQTKGKAWFWESSGTPRLDTGLARPDISLIQGDREIPAKLRGQFVTEADAWQTDGASLSLEYRLTFAVPEGDGPPRDVTVLVKRAFAPLAGEGADPTSGVSQTVTAGPLPPGTSIRLHVLAPAFAAKVTCNADGTQLAIPDGFGSRIVCPDAGARFAPDATGVTLAADKNGEAKVVLHYLTNVPIDRLAVPPPAPPAGKPTPVEVGPGFVGERLPLPPAIMPTAINWRPNGRLVFSSLKGQLYEATDADGDGYEDGLTLLTDGLPAPYGVNAGPGYVDVTAKYGVLRVPDATTSVRRVELIASGWGYTTDYHDWAVGLPRNARGEYYLGIPCEQDKRPLAATRFHGNILRLVPRTPTAADARRFSLEPISGGSRFPMGLALDRDGELFVSDNQGNYKPFNELNHVRTGAHFGFINSIDRGKPAPVRQFATIEIPHPWTRSVNGLCFLDTPKELRAKTGQPAFGPFEGHLVGCEFNGRKLIRMTMQKVGDIYQGAAYPLSVPSEDPARGFLGPLACAVSRNGELYVSGVWDSGWGAGNNVGEIVRVRMEPEKLPAGLAEVRATAEGFTLDFVKPVDRNLASRPESYAVESYRREATPAYGGTDADRRTEKVAGVTLSADGKRATLKLPEMRAGFVYEFRLKNLAAGSGEFHPAEAHYTLRVVPK